MTRNLAAENFGIAGAISYNGLHYHLIDGDLTGFYVMESFEGRDLDGDGTTSGYVWHVRDSGTGRLWSFDKDWGLWNAKWLGEGVYLGSVFEGDLGRDENGDGDMLDWLPLLFDFATEVETIVPFAYATSIYGPVVSFIVDGTNALILADEQNQQADLNLDGDLADQVIYRLDVKTGVVVNLGIACARSVWDTEDGFGVVWRDEASDGNVDLNGDGDTADIVPHLYEFSSGVLTNVGIATDRVSLGEGILFLLVPESGEGPGGTDLNGDGDKADSVVHYRPLGSSAITNVGFASTSDMHWIPSGVTRDALIWRTFEGDQGEDLNGDGDLEDYFDYVHKFSTATTTNLGFFANRLAFDDGILVHTVDEYENGDVNGDGELDFVARIHDVASETTTFVMSEIDPPSPPRFAGGRVALTIDEDGRDLNGNGRTQDLLVAVVDPKTGFLINTRTEIYAATTGESFTAVLHFDGDYVVFSAREANEWGEINGDVNGDGDLRDIVLVAFDVRAGKTNPKRRRTKATRLVLGALYHWSFPFVLEILSGFSLKDGVVVFENNEINSVGVGGPRTDFNGDGDKRDPVMHRIRLP